MTEDLAPDVVTVTLNPAIDLTVTLDRFVVGTVQRATAAVSTCGGKGINVAGCLADWGVRVTATGVLGRANDGTFAEFFARKGIADRFVRTSGETRTNIKIADRTSGETTDVNLPGLIIPDAVFESVRKALMDSVAPGRPVVLAGSLPETLPATAWAEIANDLSGPGARVVLDTSGAPLAAALKAGVPIHAVKPNRAELEALVGHPLAGAGELVEAARALLARGLALVVVSLGAEGALFVDRETALAARLPARTVLSTVGAGDAMVAGIVAALVEDAPLERVARLSTAFAASKLDRIGPYLGPAEDIERLATAVSVTLI
ncbi:1-phosphofructokinase [Blastochloris sulfoviridis]|uniref:Phosphofructokinase n=1 Tax=Blastochloris sulfoviridis TaxID=50712 RepID=A0A5M6HZ18_9HYPH|nr:1-phosphofructokinase [Blastochloris sulfoviridis]KAA5601162.1 1-phosphofructokinase [Blastochloris sulfoviridis]